MVSGSYGDFKINVSIMAEVVGNGDLNIKVSVVMVSVVVAIMVVAVCYLLHTTPSPIRN